MSKPCIECPFKKENAFSFDNIFVDALRDNMYKNRFPCHMKHPTADVFNAGFNQDIELMADDCIGRKKMEENITHSFNPPYPQDVPNPEVVGYWDELCRW